MDITASHQARLRLRFLEIRWGRGGGRVSRTRVVRFLRTSHQSIPAGFFGSCSLHRHRICDRVLPDTSPVPIHVHTYMPCGQLTQALPRLELLKFIFGAGTGAGSGAVVATLIVSGDGVEVLLRFGGCCFFAFGSGSVVVSAEAGVVVLPRLPTVCFLGLLGSAFVGSSGAGVVVLLRFPACLRVRLPRPSGGVVSCASLISCSSCFVLCWVFCLISSMVSLTTIVVGVGANP